MLQREINAGSLRKKEEKSVKTQQHTDCGKRLQSDMTVRYTSVGHQKLKKNLKTHEKRHIVPLRTKPQMVLEIEKNCTFSMIVVKLTSTF